MRPFLGIAMELAALSVILGLSVFIPQGATFLLYTLALELTSTYLVHCPAHYLVGMGVGIKFRSIRLSRTTLARALPSKLAPAARLLPVLTLSTERSSLSKVSPKRRALMFRAGTIASCLAAFAVAIAASFVEPYLYAALGWVLAAGYLAFDVVFSPRTGDFKRARSALQQDTHAR